MEPNQDPNLTQSNGVDSMEHESSAEPDSTTAGYPDDEHAHHQQNPRAELHLALGTNGSSLDGSSPSQSSHQHIQTLLSQLESLDDLNRLIEAAGGVDGENGVDNYELPRSLIVTNLDSRIFTEGTPERIQFEDTFREVDQSVTFLFFKSFRRARIDFAMSLGATKARILCNQRRIGEETINCYYAEVCDIVSNMLLRPPALEKQFLISPPASPPEGWQPSEEAQPVLNFDLQSALACLIPGSTHELHPASDSQPGIVVHIAPDTTFNTTSAPDEEEIPEFAIQAPPEEDEDEDDGFVDGFSIATPSLGGGPTTGTRRIPQTACPPSMSAAAAGRDK